MYVEAGLMQCRECRTRASSRESMVAMVQMFIDKGTSREDAEKMVGDKTLEQFLLDNKDSLFPPPATPLTKENVGGSIRALEWELQTRCPIICWQAMRYFPTDFLDELQAAYQTGKESPISKETLPVVVVSSHDSSVLTKI